MSTVVNLPHIWKYNVFDLLQPLRKATLGPSQQMEAGRVLHSLTSHRAAMTGHEFHRFWAISQGDALDFADRKSGACALYHCRIFSLHSACLPGNR